MKSSGYKVALEGKSNILKTGESYYWDSDFTNIIQSVNQSKSVRENIFPHPLPDSEYKGVSFVLVDSSGKEVLKNSISLREIAIPRRCLKKLQCAIDQIHSWAEDPRVPQEKRDFCRNFSLPDPKKDPNAYRFSGGVFSRKLHVLWGYQKNGTESFRPLSKISKDWGDAATRKNIFKVCRRSFWRYIFSFKFFLLLLFVFGGKYAFDRINQLTIICPIHNCSVGKGIEAFWERDERCPQRCSIPGCGRHLDNSWRCSVHACKFCGKDLPSSSELDGVCEDCFWRLK